MNRYVLEPLDEEIPPDDTYSCGTTDNGSTFFYRWHGGKLEICKNWSTFSDYGPPMERHSRFLVFRNGLFIYGDDDGVEEYNEEDAERENIPKEIYKVNVSLDTKSITFDFIRTMKNGEELCGGGLMREELNDQYIWYKIGEDPKTVHRNAMDKDTVICGVHRNKLIVVKDDPYHHDFYRDCDSTDRISEDNSVITIVNTKGNEDSTIYCADDSPLIYVACERYNAYRVLVANVDTLRIDELILSKKRNAESSVTYLRILNVRNGVIFIANNPDFSHYDGAVSMLRYQLPPHLGDANIPPPPPIVHPEQARAPPAELENELQALRAEMQKQIDELKERTEVVEKKK